ncbi:MAG: hypothetical protein IPL83_02400 [Bdellovibrionales bacterium]|nr:hypothetical protein [Bdellovibrionales bacterium]
MKNNTYFRFVAFSTFAAILLSVVTLLFMNRLSSVSSTVDRDRFLVLYAESIEELIAGRVDLTKIENPLMRPPPRPGHKPPIGTPPFENDDRPPRHDFNSPDRPPRRPFKRPEFWLVDEIGAELFSSQGTPLPVALKDLPRPETIHEVLEKADFFRLRSGFQIVRLDHPTPLFLIAKDPERPSILQLFATQLIVIFLTVTLAFLTSVFFLFVYLRKNAEKARSVLRSLGQGDLTVRFKLKKFDEFGGLLGEFNQMADKIQHLVQQVHHTEQTRKNLLQELGHDLRTPLSALRTASETLKLHNSALNEQERIDLLNMIEQETIYFGELLENLLEVASLDEPQFNANSTCIDLAKIRRNLKSS